jgi:REP element-mobilizing transposase RayT
MAPRTVDVMPRDFDPDAIYHLTVRGSNKRDIVETDLDRTIWIQLVGAQAIARGWIVYAYCLMTNHYHLVLLAPQNDISAGMQRINTDFSRRVNALHGESAHRLKNRFGAKLVRDEAHLLQVIRYVDLNPVRAGMEPFPEDHRWSSFRALAGLEEAQSFLAVEETLSLYGSSPACGRTAYRRYVHEALGLWIPNPWADESEPVLTIA